MTARRPVHVLVEEPIRVDEGGQLLQPASALVACPGVGSRPLNESEPRVTFWKPGNEMIILLTVFQKTRDGVQKADVDRAIRAKKTCQPDHEMMITHYFERNA